MKTQLLILMLLTGLFSACSVEPQPIRYGEEACAFCKMSITDQRYGAEVVTNKGKAYKYDATECMLHALHQGDVPHEEVALYLVTDAEKQGTLISAEQAHYLISEKLPSPMGENITAFATPEAQAAAKAKFGGETLSWEELQQQFAH